MKFYVLKRTNDNVYYSYHSESGSQVWLDDPDNTCLYTNRYAVITQRYFFEKENVPVELLTIELDMSKAYVEELEDDELANQNARTSYRDNKSFKLQMEAYNKLPWWKKLFR